MPGKSRGKARRLSQQKRRKEVQRPLAATQPPAAAVTPGATTTQGAAPAARTTPRTGVPAPVGKSATGRYPYVVGELVRIGILTGVVLVILFILAFILPRA